MRDNSEVESEAAGLVVDEILDVSAEFPVAAGHDVDGQQYVIIDLSGIRVWAPISPLALRCVVTGRAELSDAFRHTQTGYVVVVTFQPQGDTTTSVLLCRDIPDDLLPHRSAVLAA
jgi:hypothetical protein